MRNGVSILASDAGGAENDAKSHEHHADARLAGRLGGRLPTAADIRQEPFSGFGPLAEHLVAAIAVVTHGRRGNARGGS